MTTFDARAAANAQDFADEVGRIARVYRPTTMPTTFFIDREGVIQRKLVSGANEGVLRVLMRGLIAQ